MADLAGLPGDRCPVSLHALGPHGMVKSDLTCFSYLRILGGRRTWRELRQPARYSHGRPRPRDGAQCVGRSLPGPDDRLRRSWRTLRATQLRQPDATALALALQRPPGALALRSYYCTGIAIPPALVKKGRMRCRIRLVTILEPHLQSLDDQAAATRESVRLDLKKADPESSSARSCRNAARGKPASSISNDSWCVCTRRAGHGQAHRRTVSLKLAVGLIRGLHRTLTARTAHAA